MVDTRYRNKQNGKVAVVMQEDAKYKTALIQYEDDGKEQEISFSTLKRWWEEIEDDDEVVDDEDLEEDDLEDDEDEEYEEDDDEDEEVDEDEEEDFDEEDEDALDEDGDDKEEEEEVEEDDLAGDGTPLKEVGKQIAEQAKKKAEKAKAEAKTAKKPKGTRQTKPENKDNANIIEYLSSAIEKRGGVVQRHQTNYGNAGSYKVDGRRFGRYRSTKADVRIYFRFNLVKSLKKPAKNYPNEPFGAEYIFTKLTKDDKKLIDSLLDLALKTQHDINVQRSEKKTAKKEPVKKEQSKKAPAKKETAKKPTTTKTTKKK